MNARRITLTIAFLALTWAGCSAPVKITPGMSALRVKIVAEAKTGYRPPQSSYTRGSGYDATYVSTEVAGKGTPFERVNYDSLEDVVVWIEPETPVPHAPNASSISVPIPPLADRAINPPIYACGIGASIVFINRGGETESVYSFSDPNGFDLGAVAPAHSATYLPGTAGTIEILTDSSDDPVAIVYVAPTHDVRRITSGKSTVFNNLSPGRYRAFCWHPRLPGASTEVVLAVDQLTETALTVSVNRLPHAR